MERLKLLSLCKIIFCSCLIIYKFKGLIKTFIIRSYLIDNLYYVIDCKLRYLVCRIIPQSAYSKLSVKLEKYFCKFCMYKLICHLESVMTPYHVAPLMIFVMLMAQIFKKLDNRIITQFKSCKNTVHFSCKSFIAFTESRTFIS